jgi:hypothetical protein
LERDRPTFDRLKFVVSHVPKPGTSDTANSWCTKLRLRRKLPAGAHLFVGPLRQTEVVPRHKTPSRMSLSTACEARTWEQHHSHKAKAGRVRPAFVVSTHGGGVRS